VFALGNSFTCSLLVWLLVCRQGQTPQRGDRLLGLATADKEESAELHSGAILACTRRDANTESSEEGLPDFKNANYLELCLEFLTSGVTMRKSLPLLVTLLLIISQSHSSAEPPLPGLEISDRVVIEACVLTSEKPHLSTHVRGTMNVTGRTVCKGISAGRNLQVSVTLIRSDGGNTPPITKSSRGNGTVIVNIAMPCIWRRGDAKVKYTITTVHKMSNGKSGKTSNKADLQC
jgi:hypothetical protein